MKMARKNTEGVMTDGFTYVLGKAGRVQPAYVKGIVGGPYYVKKKTRGTIKERSALERDGT